MKEIYFVKSVDNSRWTPAPNPHEGRYYIRLLLTGAALVGLGVLFSQERHQTREYGYEVERLERQKMELIEANRKLHLEMASLGDPLRIDSIARNELGMATLAPQQIYESRPATAGPTVVAAQRSAPDSLR
jgi:cell division protein FtsL